ncbi:MAG: hypothetical protein A2075_11665 [Geobacteraceae bacterium GWC2_58_44]|nr:MAG: hypothetical protein A2075_11665 [Geobacteraceae bacterium GWC2_58_44]
MFRIFFTLIVAALLALGTAGSACADFADKQLIRVYYDRNGSEVATVLGNVADLVGKDGSFPGSFGPITTGYAVYFALDRTAGVSQLWASGSATPPVIVGGSTGLTGIKNGSTPMYTWFNNNGDRTNYTGSAATSNSYMKKLSATQGTLASAITLTSRLETEAPIDTLIGADSGSVTQTLYFWENALTTDSARKRGVAVATITTNFDGSTSLSPPPGAATKPARPTIGTVTAMGTDLIRVAFTPPASDGGSSIKEYTVTSSPDSVNTNGRVVIGAAASTSIDVSGLLSSTAYTFTMTATNNAGLTSDPSEPSQSVTTDAATPATPKEQVITPVTFSPDTLKVGGKSSANATGGASGNPVIFSTNSGTVCKVENGSEVTGLAFGDCIIVANQAGNDEYAAATAVSATIQVTPGSQSIGALGFTPATVKVGGKTTASATASSLLPVSFSSITEEICSVDQESGLVTGKKIGDCIIAADQIGNSDYGKADQVTGTIPVARGEQSIGALGFAPATVKVGGKTTASAAASSLLPVSFSSITEEICSVDKESGLVTGKKSGNCVIAADQAGDTSYDAAVQVTGSIPVAKGDQSIGAISFAPATLKVGGITTASAAASSGLAVTFTSASTEFCRVNKDSGIVTGLKAGSCTIAADQAGNENYLQATQSRQEIEVARAAQAILSFTFTPDTVNVGDSTQASATASSGLAVTFHSTTPTVCSESGPGGATITINSSGTCTIAANQAGDLSYQPVSELFSIGAGLASQTISFGAAPSVVAGGSATISATASSGLTVTFTTTTPAVCSVSGSTVTGISAGSCSILARQPGNAVYNAASPVTLDITIGKTGQSIGVITLAPSPLAVGGSSTASASGGASGNPVSFGTTTGTICSVNGNTVTAVAAGICSIFADQAGNQEFGPAPRVTREFTVAKGSQSIGAVSFDPPSIGVAASTTALATSSAGLAVNLRTTTPAICSVNNDSGVVTGVSAGSCSIVAEQPGNDDFLAATPVTQSLTIGKTGQSIGTISFAPSTVSVRGSTTASAAATSGLAVSFSSETPAVCSVSGSIVTGVTAGTCSIAADQAGNGSYDAAPLVIQSISVSAILPDAPTGVSATPGDARATVSFSAPAFNGGSPITGYTVTSTPGGFTGTGQVSPITVTGLNNGTAYSFTVTATNTIGSSQQSSASGSLIPAAVPGSAAIVSVTAGDAQVTISFSAPASNGGSPITGYSVSSHPAGGTDSNAGSSTLSHVITGLSNGTAYTFTVTASNAVGSGAASAPSDSVTPAFTLVSFTVSPTAGANGGITPATAQSAKAGQSLGFTVTPDAGYQISTVTGCGGTLNGNSYSTAGMTGNCRVSATFIAVPPLKGDLNGSGSIDIADAMLALRLAILGPGRQSPAQIAAGDVAPLVNRSSEPDRKLDIADAVAILRKTVDATIWQ